jgi:hypothetical protein
MEIKCTHPDHVDGQSCEERAVGCHSSCDCCIAIESRPTAAQLRSILFALPVAYDAVSPFKLYCGDGSEALFLGESARNVYEQSQVLYAVEDQDAPTYYRLVPLGSHADCCPDTEPKYCHHGSDDCPVCEQQDDLARECREQSGVTGSWQALSAEVERLKQENRELRTMLSLAEVLC